MKLLSCFSLFTIACSPRTKMDAHETVDDRLLSQLCSKDQEIRDEAERTLDSLGPDGLEALLNITAIEETKRRRNRRKVVTIIAFIYAVMILAQILIEYFFRINIQLVGALGGIMGGLGAAFAFSTTQQNATYALTRYNDVRAIGPFTVGLAFQSKPMQKAVEDKLIELLPQMRASDAKYLDDSQRAALNKQLDRNQSNPELVKAILLAWQQVGDEQAIPHVERLSYNAARSEEIRQAATDCLPFLRQSAAGIKTAQTLLRASDGGATYPEELLRAAADESVTNPNELLRAGPSVTVSAGSIQHLPAEEQVTVNTGSYEL